MNDRDELVALYRAALDAVHAGRAVARALPEALAGAGPVVVLAVGKAALAMAAASVAALGERVQGGAVCSARAGSARLAGLRVREAAHPLPDARSVAAAEEALRIAAHLRGDETLLVLLSGGASSLWCAPVEGVTLADKRATGELLLRSGADIAEINAVRKHLSRIKGGWLARAAGPERVATLAVSDVRGNRPDTIGSGPTVADATRHTDALGALERYGLLGRVPETVRAHLEEGARGRRSETPKADELGATRFRVVACLDDALAAAAAARASEGPVVSLGAFLYGDVADLARGLAARVRDAADHTLLIAGGEPSVRVRGPGRGGRCQELALRLALELEGERGWTALCAGTDGADGSTDAAGAVVDSRTLERARARGLAARECLARSDSFALLEASGDLLRTGPTDTNVSDVVLIRVHR